MQMQKYFFSFRLCSWSPRHRAFFLTRDWCRSLKAHDMSAAQIFSKCCATELHSVVARGSFFEDAFYCTSSTHMHIWLNFVQSCPLTYAPVCGYWYAPFLAPTTWWTHGEKPIIIGINHKFYIHFSSFLRFHATGFRNFQNQVLEVVGLANTFPTRGQTFKSVVIYHRNLQKNLFWKGLEKAL